MGVFEQFPYVNMHEMNLDWLLKKMKELDKAMETFKATESLKFADPIIWDITTQYEKSTIVLDPTGDAYLSLQAVPTGVQLNNDEYWLEIFNFTDYTRTANQNLTVNTETNTTRATAAYQVDDWLIWNDVLYRVTSAIAIDDALIVAPDAGSNIVHFTVEDFIKAFITYATGLIQQYKNDIDASELDYKNEMHAEVDRILAGATVDSEVIDARMAYDGVTYTTLGQAIRSQISNIHNLIDIDALIDYELVCNGNTTLSYDGWGINGTDGTFITNPNLSVTAFFIVKDIDGIYLTMPHTTAGLAGVAFYNENDVFISGANYGDDPRGDYTLEYVDVPDNAYYLRCTMFNGGGGTPSKSDFMLAFPKMSDNKYRIVHLEHETEYINRNRAKYWTWGAMKNDGTHFWGTSPASNLQRTSTLTYVDSSIDKVVSISKKNLLIHVYDSADSFLGYYNYVTDTISMAVPPMTYHADFALLRSKYPTHKFRIVYMDRIDVCLYDLILLYASDNPTLLARQIERPVGINQTYQVDAFFTGRSYNGFTTPIEYPSNQYRFVGGMLGQNGKVYMIPTDNQRIGEFDPKTNEITYFHFLSNTTRKYTACVCGNNGKIYALPRKSNTILEIDPIMQSAKEINVGLPNTGNEYAYSGCMIGKYIYLAPRNTNRIYKIDIELEYSTYIQLSTNYNISSCVLVGNYIYMISTNGYILKVDTTADTVTTIGTAQNYVCYGAKYYLPDSCIYGFRQGDVGLVKIDTTTDTVSIIHPECASGAYGTVYGADGLLYNVPGNTGNIYQFDPAADTITLVDTFSEDDMSAVCAGGVLCPDGSVVCIPAYGKHIYKYNFTTPTIQPTRQIPIRYLMSQWVNKY